MSGHCFGLGLPALIVYEGDFVTKARKGRLGIDCENERKGLHGLVFTNDRMSPTLSLVLNAQGVLTLFQILAIELLSV